MSKFFALEEKITAPFRFFIFSWQSRESVAAAISSTLRGLKVPIKVSIKVFPLTTNDRRYFYVLWPALMEKEERKAKLQSYKATLYHKTQVIQSRKLRWDY